MSRHKRNEPIEKIRIPLEQIKYEPAKIRERLKKIQKKRAIVNKGLSAVSFVLIIAAIVLLVLFFIDGNSVTIDNERILLNLKSLFDRNSEIIAAHTKANFMSIKNIAVGTFVSLIAQNFQYFGTGIKEVSTRLAINIFPEQSLNRLLECLVTNSAVIGIGFKQLISNIQNNFSPLSQGFHELLSVIGEKLQQIRK